MAEDAGFVLGGEFYPTPQAFRLGDPVLIAELTGLTFPEFAEALGDEDRRSDPSILVGLIGVSVWQKHPKWTRARVVAYVQALDLGSLQFQGGEEDEDVPPEVTELGKNSPSSDTTSESSPDTSVDPSSPTSPGAPGLDTGSPPSLQAA